MQRTTSILIRMFGLDTAGSAAARTMRFSLMAPGGYPMTFAVNAKKICAMTEAERAEQIEREWYGTPLPSHFRCASPERICERAVELVREVVR